MTGNKFYIILDGKVEVWIKASKDEAPTDKIPALNMVAVLSTGTVFG